jgi:hypothetical protein
MNVGKMLRLSLVGGAVIATIAVIGLRLHHVEARAAVAQTPQRSTTATDRSDQPAALERSIAESPAERERTLQARRLLAAALVLGAAASQGVPPAQAATEPEAKATEDSVEDPHENRRRIVDAFTASGNATGDWTQSAPRVFSGIRKSVPAALARHVDVRNVECYEKGCIADVTYSDMNAFEKSAELFLQDNAFESWPGPRGRTAPETMASGRVEVTWMLMNPNEGNL